MNNRSDLADYPEVMDTAQVSELLGHPPKQIQVMAREGRLPAHREAGAHQWRFHRDELLAWLAVGRNQGETLRVTQRHHAHLPVTIRR